MLLSLGDIFSNLIFHVLLKGMNIKSANLTLLILIFVPIVFLQGWTGLSKGFKKRVKRESKCLEGDPSRGKRESIKIPYTQIFTPAPLHRALPTSATTSR